MSKPTEEECQKFLANPKINPRTGKTLYKSGNFYKMLIAICRQKSSGRVYTKKELNAMAKGFIDGYTKMSQDDLVIALQNKLKDMNITMEERYNQIKKEKGEEPKPTKEKEPELISPKPKKVRPAAEILKNKHKIKLTLTRTESNPDDINVKIKMDDHKTKGSVNAKNIKRVLDQFFADTIDKDRLIKEASGDNYVVMYSITNKGLRFHIPTSLDEIDYDRMKIKNLPFEISMREMNSIHEKIGNSHVSYYRLTEGNINTIADYDIFDESYVNNLSEQEPMKVIFMDIIKKINKDIRSL
jgi:hypothetical protein